MAVFAPLRQDPDDIDYEKEFEEKKERDAVSQAA